MRGWKVVAGLVAVAAGILAARTLPLAVWTVASVSLIRESGVWGVLLFVGIYAASTVAMLPGSILTMAGGFIYGPVYGLLVVIPASLAGATCSFLLGRTVLRGWVRRKLEASPRTRALDRAVEREAFKLVLLLRLSPLVPFNALNYALSITGIPLKRFVAATLVGEIPGGWLYVYLGSLVTTVAELSSGQAPRSPLRLAFYAVGLVATAAAAVVTARIATRALTREVPGDEAECASPAGASGGSVPPTQD